MRGLNNEVREAAARGLPRNVDHLVFAAPELGAGVEYVENALGVRPIPGGRHPAFGTCNAVLSLGPTTYLEVIAPDPGLERPPRGRVFGLDEIDQPEMRTWAIRTEDIATDVARARAAGAGIGPVQAGSRERRDGTLLRWRLSDPYAMPLLGAVPFLISWGPTPHPATSAPAGGELIGLRIEHPDPDAVRAALQALDLEVAVSAADRFSLIATVRSAAGVVEVR